MSDRLPRGHAYIRIRSNGFSVHIDFRDKDVPFVEEMLKLVMDRHKAWRDDEEGSGHAVVDGATGAIPEPKGEQAPGASTGAIPAGPVLPAERSTVARCPSTNQGTNDE